MTKLACLALIVTGEALRAANIHGVVLDASSIPAPSAVVSLSNPRSRYVRRVLCGSDGAFAIPDTPRGEYLLSVSLAGFQTHQRQVTVESESSLRLTVRLEMAEMRTRLTVAASADQVVENHSAAAESIDRGLLNALPTLSPDSGLNDAIILTTAGVAADSNGFFHPFGDHAQVSYVIDGQPVADQRNKVFSTSIPANAIQRMEVIYGSPAAEFGDKTSLVIDATTRSGLGGETAASLTASYGSFGTAGEQATLSTGTSRWGNFLAANFERSGRFLDTPEFRPAHDSGNTGVIFNRADYQPGGRDAFHLNVLAARNWMQVPDTYDHPGQDQRQKVLSFNAAAGWQHTFGAHTVANLNAWMRRDWVDYYPSRDPLQDSPATVAQGRSLANFGLRGDVSRIKGRHNWKAGYQVSRTLLDEEFRLGITDPAYNSPSDAEFLPALMPYDLTRGGHVYEFRGRATIGQMAAFAQDTVTLGSLSLTTGTRYDRYRGLSRASALQPRGSFSYLFRRTGTVLRGGYSHTMETPTNENLVVSSSTGPGGLAGSLFAGAAGQRPIVPGRRNQYDAGIRQQLGRWVTLDVDYFRKYTRDAFDFDALFSTPLTFPIGWKQSKLDGISGRIATADLRGLRAYVTMGHANARFFGPEVGGIVFHSNLSVGAYRQDHDQVYQQNVNLHYQKPRSGWWADVTWRYDSGLVAGAVNTLQDALDLTANQQAAIGLYCGPERATGRHRIASCASSTYGATRIAIPAPGTDNPDHNPPRTTARHIWNVSVGTDNLFHTDRIHTAVRFTVLNLANVAALYNFLSPFSGTHWVQPRSYQARLGWSFR